MKNTTVMEMLKNQQNENFIPERHLAYDENMGNIIGNIVVNNSFVRNRLDLVIRYGV